MGYIGVEYGHDCRSCIVHDCDFVRDVSFSPLFSENLNELASAGDGSDVRYQISSTIFVDHLIGKENHLLHQRIPEMSK